MLVTRFESKTFAQALQRWGAAHGMNLAALGKGSGLGEVGIYDALTDSVPLTQTRASQACRKLQIGSIADLYRQTEPRPSPAPKRVVRQPRPQSEFAQRRPSYAAALFYLMQEQGWTPSELARQAGTTAKNVSAYLMLGQAFSEQMALVMAKPFKITDFDTLIAEGMRAAGENPYLPERCAQAIRALIPNERYATVTALARDSDISPSNLSDFLKGNFKLLSIGNVLHVGRQLEATGFGHLYQLGGVPLPDKPEGIIQANPLIQSNLPFPVRAALGR